MREVDAVVGIGQLAESVITEVARLQKLKPLEFPEQAPPGGQALAWLRDGHEPPFLFTSRQPQGRAAAPHPQIRHRRAGSRIAASSSGGRTRS